MQEDFVENTGTCQIDTFGDIFIAFTAQIVILIILFYPKKSQMRHQVRVSSHPNGGRKVHSKLRDYIHLQDKRKSIEKAMEISKRMGGELKIAKKGETPRYGNTYGGDPFPPRWGRY